MAEALILLRVRLAHAEAARTFHLARRRRGNLDALVAGLQVAWLRDIIREMEAAHG